MVSNHNGLYGCRDKYEYLSNGKTIHGQMRLRNPGLGEANPVSLHSILGPQALVPQGGIWDEALSSLVARS